MDTLRIGIVGAGWMGAEHAKSWLNNAPRGEVVAVADASASRAQHLIESLTGGRARAYPDLDALLADPGVDAVDICLPHHLHADAIVRAARAGKAILCEKPLCTTLEDAAAIRDVLEATGVTFMAAHNQLFQPSLVEACRLIENGVLGRPYVYRSIEVGQNRGFRTGHVPVELGDGENSWAWRADPRRMGGGEVLDTGWHATYRLLALASAAADGEDRPVEVTAMMERFFVQELPQEDTGLLLVRFASGAIGEIVTSWAFGFASGWQFEVAAERGCIAGNRTRLVHQIHGWPEPAERTNEAVHTYTREVTHFLNVVQRGERPRASFAHAARALQLTLAAYRAVAERRTVTLPDDPTRLDEAVLPVVGARAGSW